MEFRTRYTGTYWKIRWKLNLADWSPILVGRFQFGSIVLASTVYIPRTRDDVSFVI